jgi:hypothetical protein
VNSKQPAADLQREVGGEHYPALVSAAGVADLSDQERSKFFERWVVDTEHFYGWDHEKYWPSADSLSYRVWNLFRGQVVDRQLLHARFGGRADGRVSPSDTYPFTFVFLDEEAERLYGRWARHPERPRGPTANFVYRGEAQATRAPWSPSNRPIAERGERSLRFFAGVTGSVRFLGVFVLGRRPAIRWESTVGPGGEAHVPVFTLSPVGGSYVLSPFQTQAYAAYKNRQVSEYNQRHSDAGDPEG